MEFEKIVLAALQESNVAGGAGSVYGGGVEATAAPFSNDRYTPDDARNVMGGAFPGVQTRRGMTGKRSKKSKKGSRKTRRS